MFYHPDYTGNTSFITDKDGEIVAKYHYKPYGEIALVEGTDAVLHKTRSVIKKQISRSRISPLNAGDLSMDALISKPCRKHNEASIDVMSIANTRGVTYSHK